MKQKVSSQIRERVGRGQKWWVAGLVLVLVVGGGIGGWWWGRGQLTENSARYIASFYPLQEFTQAVVGSEGQVSSLVPPGVAVHDYEPGPQTVAELRAATALIYNGAGLEHWVEELGAPVQAELVDASADIALIGEGHQANPHLWLSPALAARQVSNIERRLSEIEPEKAVIWQANAANYRAELAALDEEFATGLANCQVRTVISWHDVLPYVGQDYGFTTRALTGLDSHEEPAARDLAEVVDLIRAEQIPAVLAEKGTSARLLETLAAETGVQILEYDPVERGTDEERGGGRATGEVGAIGDEVGTAENEAGVTGNEAEATGGTYLSRQRSNLAVLQQAMQCQK